MSDSQQFELDTSAFDWQNVRQRLEAIKAALNGPSETAPEVLERVWAHRAAKLAQTLPQEEDEQIEIVLVQLGREIYGLEAQYVLDIRLAEQITRVPRVPDWVAGIVNLRGRIVSVLDLQRLFKLPQTGRADKDVSLPPHLVVVETPDTEVALLVDKVLAVESLSADGMQTITDTVHGLGPEYVRGVCERKDGENDLTMIVLDLLALFGDKRLNVYEEIS